MSSFFQEVPPHPSLSPLGRERGEGKFQIFLVRFYLVKTGELTRMIKDLPGDWPKFLRISKKD